MKGHSRCPWDNCWAVAGSTGICPLGHFRLMRGNLTNIQKRIRNPTSQYLITDHKEHPRQGREYNLVQCLPKYHSFKTASLMGGYINVDVSMYTSFSSTHPHNLEYFYQYMTYPLFFLLLPIHHTEACLKAGFKSPVHRIYKRNVSHSLYIRQSGSQDRCSALK